MFCPNCKSRLSKDQKDAQNIFWCEYCQGKFFIIITTSCKELTFCATCGKGTKGTEFCSDKCSEYETI